MNTILYCDSKASRYANKFCNLYVFTKAVSQTPKKNTKSLVYFNCSCRQTSLVISTFIVDELNE